MKGSENNRTAYIHVVCLPFIPCRLDYCRAAIKRNQHKPFFAPNVIVQGGGGPGRPPVILHFFPRHFHSPAQLVCVCTRLWRELYITINSLSYILRICHVIRILCNVGGGAPLVWYESRGTGRCFSSSIVLRESGSPPPQPTGRGAMTRSLWRPRPPMVAKPLTTPNSEVASILRCSPPYSALASPCSALAWLPLPYLPSLC